MSQAIKNVLHSFAFDKVEEIRKKGGIVTPEILDQWEKDLHGTMVENVLAHQVFQFLQSDHNP